MLSIVGLGPGGPEHRTAAAERAVREADVVIGYGPYIDQCADLLDGQEVIRGRMGDEPARAQEAITRARAGARVALVSSGDAGVHGMAARTLAMVAEAGDPATPAGTRDLAASAGTGDVGASAGTRDLAALADTGDFAASTGTRNLAASADAPPLRVAVVPGVTAALAVAARVGAPLADDWATLSLSDLHVPWATVERRLTALVATGIALALYNPRSATRTTPFERALSILRAHREPDTPAIVATDVARPTEAIVTTTLEHLDPETVTMRTLVLVAGESAEWAGEHLIARRGA